MPIEPAPYRSPEVKHLERAVQATRKAILRKVENQPNTAPEDEEIEQDSNEDRGEKP